MSFSYNAAGQRIKKIENDQTTKYYYSGSATLYTTNANNQLLTENILDLGGSIVASLRFADQVESTPDPYANQYFFYNYDMRGSTTAIIQPDGTLIKGYSYDEFGTLEQSGATDFLNEVTFTGSVTDTSSGLQYMNARFYNPSTGRFLSQDTYTGNASEPWTQHLYSYCGNNPVNMIDPTGHRAVREDEISKPKKKTRYDLMQERMEDRDAGNSDIEKLLALSIDLPNDGWPTNTDFKNTKESTIRRNGPTGGYGTDYDWGHNFRHPELDLDPEDVHAHDWVIDDEGDLVRGKAYIPDPENVPEKNLARFGHLRQKLYQNQTK